MSTEGVQRDIHVRFLTGMTGVGDALDEILALLHSTEDSDPELILDVGCGVLESLLFEHEEELWPRIERLARDDVRFREALAAVWAYDSPAFERREALLAELGE
jgi:hypothetical protein